MGTKTSADGNVWYYVNFAKDGKEISGYIRSDYATVSGDLTPVETQQDVPEENTETEENTSNTQNDDTKRTIDNGRIAEWKLVIKEVKKKATMMQNVIYKKFFLFFIINLTLKLFPFLSIF